MARDCIVLQDGFGSEFGHLNCNSSNTVTEYAADGTADWNGASFSGPSWNATKMNNSL